MATWKQVILKDPITGEYLAPMGGNYSGGDADTLQSHPASDFLLKSEYTPVDLSEYLKTATADTKYAAANHNHNGVYAPVSHTHTTGQISDLSTVLAGYAPASHTHTTANITGLDTKLSGYDSEIASLKSSVSNGKSAVASAITDKGVSTSATASFNTMAANIKKISSGIEITSGVLPYNTFARIADGSVSAPGDYGYNEMTLPFNATSGDYLLMFELNVDSSKATPLFYCGGESEFDIPCARYLNISVRISGTTVTAEGVDKGNDRSHRITGKIWYKKF